jgi:hypothetical protein
MGASDPSQKSGEKPGYFVLGKRWLSRMNKLTWWKLVYKSTKKNTAAMQLTQEKPQLNRGKKTIFGRSKNCCGNPG